MNTHPKRLVTYALLALGAGSLLMLGPRLGIEKPRSGTASGAREIVPVELVLLVDTSGSVDSHEYQLQKDGYEMAFRDPAVVAQVASQGGIVVTYIEWSNADYQDVRIDWTKLENADDCDAFANQINAIARKETGETMLAPALQFAADRIATNDYIGFKRVIDVSGDGRGENYDYYLTNTDYSAYHGQRWEDVVRNISGVVNQVNGICITMNSGVVDFYTNVLPQNGGFMMQVDDFYEFQDAIVEKLLREIRLPAGLYD